MGRFAGLGHLRVTIAVVLAACGGNTPGELHLSTELPPDKPLLDLLPAEASHFCRRVDDFLLHEGSDTLCRYFGVATVSVFVSAGISPATEADGQKQCADMEATCHSNLMESKSSNLCYLPDPKAACTATVAEYEACFDEHLAAVNRAIPRCSELTLEEIPDMIPDPTRMNASSGPACARLFEHCSPLPTEPFDPSKADAGAN